MPSKDKDKIKAYQKLYYSDPVNKERKRQWSKAYRERRREADKAYRKTRYAEKFASNQAYHQRNAERNKERVRQWRLANPEKHREQGMRRNARKRNVTVEPVDYQDIWRKSGGKCGICGDLIMVYDQVHFDHIVPLAKGGAHAMANIQVAHAMCNIKKGARVA